MEGLDDSNLVSHVQGIEVGGKSDISLLGVERGDQRVHLIVLHGFVFVRRL